MTILIKSNSLLDNINSFVLFQPPILADFKKLRKLAEEMGLFQPQFWFYFWTLGHIILLDFLGMVVMQYFGTGWVPYMIAALLLATSQASTNVFLNKFHI